MSENYTPYLGLALPDKENFIEDDVDKIRDNFIVIDNHMVENNNNKLNRISPEAEDHLTINGKDNSGIDIHRKDIDITESIVGETTNIIKFTDTNNEIMGCIRHTYMADRSSVIELLAMRQVHNTIITPPDIEEDGDTEEDIDRDLETYIEPDGEYSILSGGISIRIDSDGRASIETQSPMDNDQSLAIPTTEWIYRHYHPKENGVLVIDDVLVVNTEEIENEDRKDIYEGNLSFRYQGDDTGFVSHSVSDDVTSLALAISKKIINETSISASISISIDANGNITTQVPSPSADANDDSIATTNWVKNTQVARARQIYVSSDYGPSEDNPVVNLVSVYEANMSLPVLSVDGALLPYQSSHFQIQLADPSTGELATALSLTRDNDDNNNLDIEGKISTQILTVSDLIEVPTPDEYETGINAINSEYAKNYLVYKNNAQINNYLQISGINNQFTIFATLSGDDEYTPQCDIFLKSETLEETTHLFQTVVKEEETLDVLSSTCTLQVESKVGEIEEEDEEGNTKLIDDIRIAGISITIDKKGIAHTTCIPPIADDALLNQIATVGYVRTMLFGGSENDESALDKVYARKIGDTFTGPLVIDLSTSTQSRDNQQTNTALNIKHTTENTIVIQNTGIVINTTDEIPDTPIEPEPDPNEPEIPVNPIDPDPEEPSVPTDPDVDPEEPETPDPETPDEPGESETPPEIPPTDETEEDENEDSGISTLALSEEDKNRTIVVSNIKTIDRDTNVVSELKTKYNLHNKSITTSLSAVHPTEDMNYTSTISVTVDKDGNTTALAPTIDPNTNICQDKIATTTWCHDTYAMTHGVVYIANIGDDNYDSSLRGTKEYPYKTLTGCLQQIQKQYAKLVEVKLLTDIDAGYIDNLGRYGNTYIEVSSEDPNDPKTITFNIQKDKINQGIECHGGTLTLKHLTLKSVGLCNSFISAISTYSSSNVILEDVDFIGETQDGTLYVIGNSHVDIYHSQKFINSYVIGPRFTLVDGGTIRTAIGRLPANTDPTYIPGTDDVDMGGGN